MKSLPKLTMKECDEQCRHVELGANLIKPNPQAGALMRRFLYGEFTTRPDKFVRGEKKEP